MAMMPPWLQQRTQVQQQQQQQESAGRQALCVITWT
jgi:hypothetical protein